MGLDNLLTHLFQTMRCFAADPSFTAYILRLTAPGGGARPVLADFFSILLHRVILDLSRSIQA